MLVVMSGRVAYISDVMQPFLCEAAFAILGETPADPEKFMLEWLQKRQAAKAGVQEDKVTIGKAEVLVKGQSGVDVAKAIEAKPFKEWCLKIGQNQRIVISSILIQSVDMFGPRVGFMKFKAETTVDRKAVPGIVFMRGGAVAILVDLKCGEERHTLLVCQPRVSVAEDALPEIPAGMLDGDGNFAGVAAKEMKEETGIEIRENDLIDMTSKVYGDKYPGMYPTCGGSDEFNRLFLFRKEVTKEEIATMEGKLTGVAEEGEQIKLKIIPFNDLYKVSPDAKALAALCLHDRLIQSGEIKAF